jgi:hypothetical protein
MASDLIVETSNGRFYVIDGHEYVSVTNVIDHLSDLVDWAAWETAGAALDHLPLLIDSTLRPGCGRSRAGHGSHSFGMACTPLCPCGVCESCVRLRLSRTHNEISSRRAKEGGEVHKYVERWVLDGVKISVSAEARPYVIAFHSLCEAYGLTPANWLMVEAVAFNRAHGYAGTTDGALRVYARASEKAAYLVASVLRISISEAVRDDRHADVMVDWKTKEKPLEPGRSAKLYPTHALQLSAYFACPEIMIKGTEHFTAMPELHGAVLVQLRIPTETDPGFTARPLDAGERTLGAFLNQKSVIAWLREHGAASVSVRTFKPAPEPRKRARKKINDAPTPEQAAATAARDAKPRKKTAASLSVAGQPGLRDDEIPF